MQIKSKAFLFFLLVVTFAKGQQASNTDREISYKEFLSLVLENHPISKQANLFNGIAAAEIRMARGFFDPKLSADFGEKRFKSDTYFTQRLAMLKIPTWYGIELKAGAELNDGFRLSNDMYTPNQGLTFVGLSIPVLQGLVIDERRAALRTAQTLQRMAEAERIGMLNKLIFAAAKEFADWYLSYKAIGFVEEGVSLAQIRYNAVKEQVKLGDLAAIDSVEARLALQDRLVQLASARLNFDNSRLLVSNFLWNEAGNPLELDSNAIPVLTAADFAAFDPQNALSMAEEASIFHPDIIKQEQKRKQLQIERRLAAEMLKPMIRLELNGLSGDILSMPPIQTGYWEQNYKFGAVASFPLFLRKERGKLQLTKLKLQNNQLEINQIKLQVANNVRQAYNQWAAQNLQLGLQTEAVGLHRILAQGEQERFLNGESSLFLVNTREARLIEAGIKQADFEAKTLKARAAVWFEAGKIAN